jgi:Transcriptional regulator PadR-like family
VSPPASANRQTDNCVQHFPHSAPLTVHDDSPARLELGTSLPRRGRWMDRGATTHRRLGVLPHNDERCACRLHHLWARARRLGLSFDIQMETRYFIGVPNREQAKADVLQGTLDLMVLQTLSTLGPSHGYAISARLEQVSAGALRVNMGTLYPGLMRLEQRGLLRAEWASLTRTGKHAST